ncbi:hypothetical protein ACFPNZ_10845, partial [Microvirga aerilata]
VRKAGRIAAKPLSTNAEQDHAAYRQAMADGRVAKDERAVLFNCATGLKYPMPPVHASLDRTKSINFAELV